MLANDGLVQDVLSNTLLKSGRPLHLTLVITGRTTLSVAAPFAASAVRCEEGEPGRVDGCGWPVGPCESRS